MGKIKGNVITKGFSGKYSDELLFRQVNGETFFVKKSQKAFKASARQTAMREKFAEAAYYAANCMENPQKSLDYKLMSVLNGKKTAYLAAVADYLSMPEVENIITVSYTGAIGDIINIKPVEPFKIVEIAVSILLQDGTVLETGKAIPHQLTWRYIATAENVKVKGSRLLLVARDRQGKEATVERLL